MRKTIFLALFFTFFAALLLAAESSVQDRRIEEGKRASLRPTEQVIFETKETAPRPPEVDIAYFKELLSRRITSISDACNVLTILMGADIKQGDPDSQIAYLKEKKVFPKNVRGGISPNTPLRKGVAAYMFCAALDIKGGVIFTLFGLNQRYAMKELVYEGMLYPGDADDIITGKELVLLFTGAVDYLDSKRQSKSAKDKNTR